MKEYVDFLKSKIKKFDNFGFENDEKHICPLQLDIIERAVYMWSNPGETVFTPFAGIGSELYQSIKCGRKGIGIELKESYFKQAVNYCNLAEQEQQQTLF